MAEKTKGTLVFDGMGKDQRCYLEEKGPDGKVTGIRTIKHGDRVEVDLDNNPEMRGTLELGSARWEDEARPPKTKGA